FEPRMHAYLKSQVELLEDVAAMGPAFPGSAFTTAEFSFGDAPMHTRKNVRDAFHGLRAITVLGNFNPNVSSLFISPSDNLAIRCPPGTTMLIPPTKDYFFTKVNKGEKRYLFQQYFHAGLQRWIDHGFRSDLQYETEAMPDEVATIEEHMANRVPFAMKLLSRVHEIHA
ncbi:hypothetical protein B0H11DRAFT_1721861, partial [Mycena galericulata]